MSTQIDEKLLTILHAHGQQFLSAFNIPDAPEHGANLDSSESEEEWTGVSSPNRGTSEPASDGGYDSCRQDNDLDELAAGSPCTPGVMVFQEPTRKRPAASFSAKELRKSFMSSRVSNITSSSMPKEKILDEESEDERSDLLASTNIQNDALLHRLVHTKLLSGSLNPELDLNHAQKGRALTGRVLELAGEAKLGKGERVFRQEQRNKAAKRVRDGLARKQRDQEQKALEEAKNLGNYHPTLKRLYDSNLSSAPKKRVRSMGMGVGNFVAGTLKLSREEIASVTGSRKRSRDKGQRGARR